MKHLRQILTCEAVFVGAGMAESFANRAYDTAPVAV